jgi:hypothetical protein
MSQENVEIVISLQRYDDDLVPPAEHGAALEAVGLRD